MRILVVEDERDLNRILAKTLSAEGYSVDACFDGLEALDYLSGAEYDVIVLDVMMPRMDGLELLERLRAQGDETPVIFLTAKDAVSDRVRGLDAGADDYLVKPFSFEELTARIRVATRKRAGHVSSVFTLADLTVDTASHTVRRGEKLISLSAKEFALLEYMIRNKGVVAARTSWTCTSAICAGRSTAAFPESSSTRSGAPAGCCGRRNSACPSKPESRCSSR